MVALVAVVLVLLAPAIVTALLLGDGLRLSLSRWLSRRSERTIQVVVARKEDLGAGVVRLEVRRRSGWPLPAFKPGQYVVLSIPREDGTSIFRAYSLSHWRRLPWSYELGIKREAQGFGSSYLVDHACVGDTLCLSSPRGAFCDPGPNSPLVLIAAGIGVTPFRSMLQGRIARRMRQPVHLHYSARQMGGLYFHAEFVALAAEHDWFHYHPRITGDDSDWRGFRGRLCGADVLASSAPQSVFMLCAGRAMEVELTTALTALGVAAARIHRENFGLGAPSCEVEGTVSCAGRSFPIGRAASLLEVLERNRVPISAECRVGECGHCEIELAEGTVRNLMNGELQTGTVLACTVVPVGSIALRLRS